jgi:hypothetical protein
VAAAGAVAARCRHLLQQLLGFGGLLALALRQDDGQAVHGLSSEGALDDRCVGARGSRGVDVVALLGPGREAGESVPSLWMCIRPGHGQCRQAECMCTVGMYAGMLDVHCCGIVGVGAWGRACGSGPGPTVRIMA